ncbi:hypothetical protein PRIPAC_89705 [Pristionchus pacificus]|uniref:Uncharacterized protein n=1 Tax=Pristionchus pacificus TaxID=54126 RepID=A0A2A6CYH6_PRIPA|nr:hypothetical protein PRIPAC_89705 [Pristionchus pacificus]|eukprot:PDM83160.1 hypothetical protein PRIPAC_37553 [Pristionchus pacificus]
MISITLLAVLLSFAPLFASVPVAQLDDSQMTTPGRITKEVFCEQCPEFIDFFLSNAGEEEAVFQQLCEKFIKNEDNPMLKVCVAGFMGEMFYVRDRLAGRTDEEPFGIFYKLCFQQMRWDAVSITVVLIVACLRWFAQLLALPILSILHFMSVFRPVQFRKLRMADGYALTGLFLILSVLLTAPLLTECCGFTYYVNGAFWAFDFAKPGTVLYTQLNLGFCVIIMLVCDVLILYKVWNMRINSLLTTVQHSCFPCLDPTAHLAISDHSHTVTVLSESHSTVRQTRQVRFEKRLTASFLLLSLSFILPTIGFNLRPVYQHWAASDLIGAVCLWVEYSKWFTYSLTTTLIRKEFIKIIKWQLLSMSVGCLCVYSASLGKAFLQLHRVVILRSTPLFFIIRVLMLLDIANIIVSQIHDIPDDIANQELFAILFLLLGVLLTAPLLTECCGFIYYVNGAYWAFDFAKPGTALYTQLNLVLQGSCVIIMFICVVLILYKVGKMRISSMHATAQHSHQHPATSDHSHTVITVETQAKLRQPRHARVEKKLTTAFLLLSLSVILPTIAFNARPMYQHWAAADLIGSLCGWIECSKWFTYSLTITFIRNEFVRTIKCQ